MSTLAHLHLLLNHGPIIGTFIAVALLVVTLFTRGKELEQVTLALFVLLALISIPVYMTGNLVQVVLGIRDERISSAIVETHQGAALLALAALQVSGAVAWAGLWQARRANRAATATLCSLLLCSLVTIGLVTVAGSTGGAIRHPEVLREPEAGSAVGELGRRLFDASQYFVAGASRWVWPVFETLHFVGLALLFGSTGLLNLRMLGFFKQLPAAPLYRFLPWAVAGLGVNIVTGMAFFVGMPDFYVFNGAFHAKVVALVAGGVTLVLYTTQAFRRCGELEAGDSAPLAGRLLAASSLLLWTAVIVFGRYMPMLEDTLDPRF